MAQALDGIASDMEQLRERLGELEHRVSTLEGQPANATPKPPASDGVAQPRSRPPETWRGFPASNLPAGVTVFGKAVLAIAGAYLLRAIAESGAIPKLPVLMLAIVYASMWLLWAVRTHAANHFASFTYAITAALILSPLLWESTVRFHVLSSVFTAAVLVAFVVLALALAWRQDLQAIPSIATTAAVTTALALIIATHELVPFTAGLLVVALVTEVVDCLGKKFGMGVVSAVAADFAVWLLVYVMTSPDGVPAEYRPTSATTITLLCLALLAIYGGCIGIRSFGLRHRLTIFEIVQGIVAFVLASFGTLRARPSSASALGFFFLLFAAVCYWGALSRFTNDDQRRNRRVCATYAVTLMLAGSLLLFPPIFQVPFLCLAAVTAAFLHMRTGKLSLGMHVSFYLTAAAILSGLLNLTGNALAGTVPSALDASESTVAVSALLCYAIGWRASTDQWKQRLLWIVPSVLVAAMGAAVAVMASVRLGSASGLRSASHLSVFRTVVICSIALIFSIGGSRLKRAELLWVAYGAIALGALKLLFEDLRFGNAVSLVASLLFYGLILILIPRLTRLGRDLS